MTKRMLIAAAAAVVLALGGFWFVVATPAGQDFALSRAAGALAGGMSPNFDGLRVFMCGSSSPLLAPGRAQACVAVTAGSDLYVIDAGAGAAATMQFSGLPTRNLRAILLTHFHSDHITGIPDVNLNSWVAGRTGPLRLVGPEGVARVAAGFNEALALDRGYRVAHHGPGLMPPAAGILVPETVAPGVVLQDGDLTVTAFPVQHPPIEPALGFRFDFRGRSVVISGDTVVTADVARHARGADLLLHDAMSLPIVRALEAAARDAGIERLATVLADIQTYHAPAAELGDLAERTGAGVLALYHLVPAPRNFLMEQVFRRDLPSGAVLTRDGMTFELPAGGTDIVVEAP